jgi:hypothetical protein
LARHQWRTEVRRYEDPGNGHVENHVNDHIENHVNGCPVQ